MMWKRGTENDDGVGLCAVLRVGVDVDLMRNECPFYVLQYLFHCVAIWDWGCGLVFLCPFHHLVMEDYYPVCWLTSLVPVMDYERDSGTL